MTKNKNMVYFSEVMHRINIFMFICLLISASYVFYVFCKIPKKVNGYRKALILFFGAFVFAIIMRIAGLHWDLPATYINFMIAFPLCATLTYLALYIKKHFDI